MDRSNESVRVLHVDDEADFAAMATEFLEREDDRFIIETATSAETGLEHLASTPVDCVISDYDMPGLSGIEFLEAVREDHPDLPFILFTGKGSEEVASGAITAGVTDYLQKRSGSEQYALLANRVRNAVERYRSERRAIALERLRNLAAEVNQTLVRATTRSSIETRVCENFSAARPYRFAWIGSYDPEAGHVEARVSAGDDQPDVIAVPVDPEADDAGTLGTAIRERSVTVADDLTSCPELEPWRDAEAEPAYQAAAAVPLGFQSEAFGLLVIYAGQTSAFDADEVELLDELGDDIGHAIMAIETAERLREERDRRSALFENNPSPVVDFEYREQTPVITAVNPAFEAVFGFDPDEVIGQSIGETLVPGGGKGKHDDIRHQVYRGERIETEVSRQTASGLRDFLLRVFPYDVDEYADGGYAWYVDISERTAHEGRIEHEQSLLEAVMETSIDGILVVNEDREYVTWNQQFLDLWGVPEDLIGDQPEEMGLEFALEQLEDPEEFTEKVEYLYDHPHGESRDQIELVDGRAFDRYSAPVEGEDGTYFGRVWFFRDVTDRVDALRELEDKNDRLEEFASIVSHDLRNPLNVAQGRLELSREERDDDHLQAVDRALERMGALIDALLTLAREGSAIETPETVDLAGLVDACWENVETAEANLVVETGTTIQADRSRLQQLLENLFRNAVEHGGEAVTVTVGALDNWTGFYVEDSGPGIPAEDRERVLESGYSTGESGTGFGLAIVHRIAQAHGWTLEVTEGDAGGARIELRGVEVVD